MDDSKTNSTGSSELAKYLILLPFALIPILWPLLEKYGLDNPESRVLFPTILFIIVLFYVFYSNERILRLFKPPKTVLGRFYLLSLLLFPGYFIFEAHVAFQSSPHLEFFGEFWDSVIRLLLFIFGTVLISKLIAELAQFGKNLATPNFQEENILNWPLPQDHIRNIGYMDQGTKSSQDKLKGGIRQLSELVMKDFDHNIALNNSFGYIDNQVTNVAMTVHRVLCEQYKWPTDSSDTFTKYFASHFSHEFKQTRLISILNYFTVSDTYHINSRELVKLIYLLSESNDYQIYQTNPNRGLMGFFIANNSYSIESKLNFEDKLKLTFLLIFCIWVSRDAKDDMNPRKFIIKRLIRDLEVTMRVFENNLGLSGARRSFTEIFISQSLPSTEIDLSFLMEKELIKTTGDYIAKLFNTTALMHQEREDKVRKEFEQLEGSLRELIEAYVIKGG